MSLDGNASSTENSVKQKKKVAKNKCQPEKTIFNNAPLLKKHSTSASTAQLRNVYEQLSVIVIEREEMDAEAERLENEQIQAANELLSKAREMNIPMDILQKVIQS